MCHLRLQVRLTFSIVAGYRHCTDSMFRASPFMRSIKVAHQTGDCWEHPSLPIYLPPLILHLFPLLDWKRMRGNQEEEGAELELWRMGEAEFDTSLSKERKPLACFLGHQDVLGQPCLCFLEYTHRPFIQISVHI